jgi:hypothetical protein
MSHKQPKLTKTEARLANLEQMVQMINIGCLSEIRGLMLTLKVKPEEFVKNVNDTIGLQVLGRNLQSETERFKAHQAKEEPIKVKTDFNKPTLQTDD